MKLYNCSVRLNGSLQNHVHCAAVTAAEIYLLRHLHGQSENAGEPVFDIKSTLDADGHPMAINRSDAQERARLASIYSLGEVSGARLVASVLGVAGVPLPQELPDVEAESAEDLETESQPEPAPVAAVTERTSIPTGRRTKIDKAAAILG